MLIPRALAIALLLFPRATSVMTLCPFFVPKLAVPAIRPRCGCSITTLQINRVQLLTIEGLLDGEQRAEHPDYEPDLNFKKAKAETDAEQQPLS